MVEDDSHSQSKVTKAVMDDKVVKEAIRHSGNEPGPSRVAQQKAEQSETSLRSEGQRTVSMLWETTQKDIAKVTVGGAVFLAIIIVLFGKWLGLGDDIRIAAFMFVAGAANLVIGFYYGRTNHQRVGGPGGDSAGTR